MRWRCTQFQSRNLIMHDDYQEYPARVPLPTEPGGIWGPPAEPSVHLTEAQVLRLQDGDLLVFRATERLSDKAAQRLNADLERLATRIEARTGKKISMIGLDSDVEFPIVVRPETNET